MKWDEIYLVIFDADGTLRRRKDGKEGPPLSDDEWELMPGVESAIDAIRSLAIVFGIASNQACVAREEVDAIKAEVMLHRLARTLRIGSQLPDLNIGAIQMCPHAPEQECCCRKPRPGMLYAIMKHWDISPRNTLMVGNSESDATAAAAANCKYMPIEQFLDLGKE